MEKINEILPRIKFHKNKTKLIHEDTTQYLKISLFLFPKHIFHCVYQM